MSLQLRTPSLLTLRGEEALATQRATALRPWFAALANRDYAPAKIAFIGDSITEGYSSTNVPARRYTDVFRNRIRSRFPTAGIGSGGGYGYMNQASMWQPFTLAAGAVGSDSFGIGRKSFVIGAGQTATFTVTGTAMRLLHVRYSTGKTLTYTIDGGSAVTYDTSAGGSAADATLSPVISLGASGSHTVVLTGVGGSCIINGVVVYDGDDTKGITVFNGGRNAAGTFDHLYKDPAVPDDPILSFAKGVQPHLAVVSLGINDWLFKKTTASSAAYKTNLATIVSDITTGCGGAAKVSIVLQAVHEGGKTTDKATGVQEPWSAYVDKMYELAAANTNVCVLDQTKRWPVASADNTLGLFNAADLLHPTDMGHAVIADELIQFLTPR